MARVHPGRYTAELPDGAVMFLIGMRINKPLRVRRWWPMFTAMPPMIAWLRKHPAAGCEQTSFCWLHGGPAFVQYWRSFEALDAFARDPGLSHLPAWRAFNQAVRDSGDVGIWHETYRVSAGSFEAVYGNMPEVGLAALGEHVPVGSTAHTAPQRMGTDAGDQPPVAPY